MEFEADGHAYPGNDCRIELRGLICVMLGRVKPPFYRPVVLCCPLAREGLTAGCIACACSRSLSLIWCVYDSRHVRGCRADIRNPGCCGIYGADIRRNGNNIIDTVSDDHDII